MPRQPRMITFDPPITFGPKGGSVKFKLKDDGTIDWVFIVRLYGDDK